MFIVELTQLAHVTIIHCSMPRTAHLPVHQRDSSDMCGRKCHLLQLDRLLVLQSIDAQRN